MWFSGIWFLSVRLPQAQGSWDTLVLADGPVWECHSWDEGLHRVSRERGVGWQRRVRGVGRVSQGRGVDVGVKSWWQSPVGRLLYWT